MRDAFLPAGAFKPQLQPYLGTDGQPTGQTQNFLARACHLAPLALCCDDQTWTNKETVVQRGDAFTQVCATSTRQSCQPNCSPRWAFLLPAGSFSAVSLRGQPASDK